jgi:hypothetical protein
MVFEWYILLLNVCFFVKMMSLPHIPPDIAISLRCSLSMSNLMMELMVLVMEEEKVRPTCF